MHKSVFTKGILFLLGLTGLASAQAFKYWDPSDTAARAPATLSASGLYVNLNANKNMITGVQAFEVNSALWSDNAKKKRWFLLKPGTSIAFNEKSDYWGFPDSAVFIKQFSIDTIEGDTLSRVLFETRLLVLKRQAVDPAAPAVKTDQWYGYSYKWRKDQKDADLVPDTGLKATIKTYPKGKTQPAVMKKWIFPSRDKCMECHRSESSGELHGRSVLGFFTSQLNMKLANGTNQLDDFFTKGYLRGTKPTNWDASPRWYGIASTDPAATLEKKSRAYIAANCSGCHGDRGKELGATFGVSLNFDYHDGVPHQELMYYETSWFYGLDTITPVIDGADRFQGVHEITPGYPQKSVLVYRQRSRNSDPADSATGFDPDRNQMPPLATFEVDEAAMKVISDWITSIPKTGRPIILGVKQGVLRQALQSPTIQGRTLLLPPSLAAGTPVVSLLGISGRAMELTRMGYGAYAIPMSAPAGIYIVRVGAKSFTRYLF